MTQIERTSGDRKKPYSNLIPIVELLVANGNQVLDGGFILTQAGWQCRVARPIDVELLLRTLELPPNVEVSSDRDTILDRLSWCVIEGPGARG